VKTEYEYWQRGGLMDEAIDSMIIHLRESSNFQVHMNYGVRLKTNEQRTIYGTENEEIVLPAVNPYLAGMIHESFSG
jgi:hypothetical protein